MPIFVRRILGSIVTAIALAFLYLIAWTVSYVLMMARSFGIFGADSSFFLDYLRMFWTLNAGEKPFFIGLGSIVIFLALAFLQRRRLVRLIRLQ